MIKKVDFDIYGYLKRKEYEVFINNLEKIAMIE